MAENAEKGTLDELVNFNIPEPQRRELKLWCAERGLIAYSGAIRPAVPILSGHPVM